MQSNGKKKKGKLMTVVPSEPLIFDITVHAFEKGARMTDLKVTDAMKLQSQRMVQEE